MYPRRSCETVFATVQFNLPPKTNMGFHSDMTWDDIDELLNELIIEEIQTPEHENYPLHYTKNQN